MSRKYGQRLTPDTRRSIARAWQRGYDLPEIQRMYNVSATTARLWIRRFETEGEAGLQAKPYRRPERPPRETPEDIKAAIRAWAEQEPGLTLTELARWATPLRYPGAVGHYHHVSRITVQRILKQTADREGPTE